MYSIRNYPCYCDQESRTQFSCNQYHLSSLERKALGCNIQIEFILLFFSYKLEQDIRGAIFSFAAYSCKRDIGIWKCVSHPEVWQTIDGYTMCFGKSFQKGEWYEYNYVVRTLYYDDIIVTTMCTSSSQYHHMHML